MPVADHKADLSRDNLVRLYIEQRLTIKETAKCLNCGETTVARALRQHCLPVRSKCDYRLSISPEELELLYVDQGLSQDEIGQLRGCSGRTVGRRLKELGITARSPGPVAEQVVPEVVLEKWTPALAYAVGLLAADGNLNRDRVRVEFVSTERDLIDLFCRALQLTDVTVVVNSRSTQKPWYTIKLDDRRLRAFLEKIGLTPAKSATIGPLAVPAAVFFDFLRGVWDGDGSWYVTNSFEGRYHYLRAELCSASKAFLEWIQASVADQIGVAGILGHHAKHQAYVVHWQKGVGPRSVAVL